MGILRFLRLLATVGVGGRLGVGRGVIIGVERTKRDGLVYK